MINIRRKIFNLMGDIIKDSKSLEEDENYHTGLVGEAIIVSAYKGMPLEKLEKLQFILSKIIKRKKENKHIQQAQQTKEENINDQ